MLKTSTGSSVEDKVVLALRFAVPAIIVVVYLQQTFGGIDPTERFFDDFFYYVKPAQNLVHGAGSTYFPGEPTNGYHPLWFLWLALLCKLAGTGAVFFGLVDLSLMALMVGFFFLFERFLRRVTAEPLAAAVGSACATIPLALIATSGVELALTVFAAALLLDVLTRKPLVEQGVRDALVVGLVGALLVLSRLDAVMLAPGLVVALAPHWDWKRWVAVAAGLSPVGAYFGFNWLTYGHFGTTSMTAKSLAVYWPPNWHFLLIEKPIPGMEILAVLAAVVIAVLLRSSENADLRRIALALAVAPLLQLGAQALLSGWMLFRWYFYFIIMALGLAAALLVVQLRRMDALRRVGIPLALIALVVTPLGVVYGVTPDKYQVEIAAMARRLQAFSADRPGVYAMGDAAGTPGWLMKQPIVHLEGLMMSHDFLDRVRQRQPLEQVFRDYHVSYYISVWSEESGPEGCRHFVEPAPLQSSARAPHMEMTSCSQPVEVISPGSNYQVRIYRIDPETGKAI
jgi:hypothetical protein